MIDLDFWPFFFLAIFGAIVANATGVGGGVVFVPAFNLLGIGSDSIIATSFAIQCFGMTAGSIAWRRHANNQLQISKGAQQQAWAQYANLILLFSVPALIGICFGQYVLVLDQASEVKAIFKGFSALFGVSILATSIFMARRGSLLLDPVAFNGFGRGLAVIVALIGGMITAWLSIGVGELIAVMLILMRYPVRLAIGVAVSVSAICVWAGAQKYLWIEPHISYDVLVFAAPAAIIGGTVARHIVSIFSPLQVKVFIAVWILISALAM